MMGWMAPLRHLGAKMPVGQKPPANREPSMNEITTIGLDLAKHVFQVHGVDAAGATVLRKQLRRAQVLAFFSRLPRCLVGMEACATAHYWARELSALGHEVRLMPAQYVKAYIKRNKNDAADAEAICEAVVRPTMRFVPGKTAEQQAAVLLHRGRERLVRKRTMLVNALRAHLAEFGVIAPQGLRNVGKLIAIIRDEEDGSSAESCAPSAAGARHADCRSKNFDVPGLFFKGGVGGVEGCFRAAFTQTVSFRITQAKLTVWPCMAKLTPPNTPDTPCLQFILG